jgi:cobalt/nickel transport system permease protein
LINNAISTNSLYSIDARVKWVGAFVIAFITLSIPLYTWAAYILILSILLAVLIASQLPFYKVIKRTFLLEIPLIFVLAPLPFIKLDTSLLPVSIMGFAFQISQHQILHIGVLLLRSWLIIFTMVLLTMTTPADDLLFSLSSIGVPEVLVNIITLMWRYLSLFISDSQKLTSAREMRSVSPSGLRLNKQRFLWNIQVTGSILGNLFLRAYERSERIFQAMQLRGFDGTLRSLRSKSLSLMQKFQIILILVFGFCFIIMAYGIQGK